MKIGFSSSELLGIQDNFLGELKLSNSGEKTSLAYIVNQIPSSSLVKDDETFQILVIGGSVFKKALVKQDVEGGIILIERDERQQPPFKTKEDFFTFVLKEVDPSVSKIAINFAYPLDPVFENNRLDGILIKGSKENTFSGLEGEKVGTELEREIKEKQQRNVTISVANDTISLLLSGLTQFSSHTIAGGIVGTGMNFALFLDNNKAVNLEAAGFDKFPQTPEGKSIDLASAVPGSALLEKEVSGAYLYKQFNFLASTQGINVPELKSTEKLDEMCLSTNPEIAKIANALMLKSASLVACVMGAITLFYGKDTVFIMEGSLFWNANGYKEHIKETLTHLVPDYSVTFGKVEDSPIYGGAKLLS